MVEVTTLGNRGNGMFEYSLEAKEGTDIRRELFKRMSGRNWPIMGTQEHRTDIGGHLPETHLL